MKKIILFSLALLCFIHCGNENDQLTSSCTLDDLTAVEPSLLADGLSQIAVTAMVLDSSGLPAANEKVFFSTTRGSITKSSLSGNDGRATAYLTSVASETDLTATVTATVLDSSSLKKTAPFYGSLTLSAPDFPTPRRLAKAGSEPSADLQVRFIGVSFSAQLERTTLPADGKSLTKLDISVRETNSGKAVKSAKVSLSSKKVIVPAQVITDEKGVVQTSIQALSKPSIDTLKMEYGRFTSRNLVLSFVSTVLSLSPKTARLSADGVSRLTYTARLVTHENNPVVGAAIRFTAGRGVINESAVTNDRGEAVVSLTSANQVSAGVPVVAIFNGISDTSRVDFVASLAAGLEMQMHSKMYRDGFATLPCTILVYDEQQKPVPNAQVRLRASVGVIDSLATTDDAGRATVTYRADAGEADAVATITAMAGGCSKSCSVQLLAVHFQLTATPDSIMADGKSSTKIYVQLKGKTGYEAIPSATISLAASLGTIVNTISTDAAGSAQALLTSSTTAGTCQLRATYGALTRTVPVYFLGSVAHRLTLFSPSGNAFPRDGLTRQSIQVRLLDNRNNPIASTLVRFRATYGAIDSSVVTDQDGAAVVNYVPDAGNSDVQETIQAWTSGTKAEYKPSLQGILLTLATGTDSTAADGKSTVAVTAFLKFTTSNAVIPSAKISFSATLGSIPPSATTDLLGQAQTSFTAGSAPGKATIRAYYGGLTQSINVNLSSDTPMTIVLSASPNYIWVKETGNLDQSVITATVLSTSGNPMGNETSVRFIIRNGPQGGERLAPATAGREWESNAIRTVSGAAKATLQSGTKSGTVEIQAYLADRPEITSRTTDVVIRSGPPYIWIDPANKNKVVPHITLASDLLNLRGWDHVSRFNLSVYVGDKYNNPVEEGTAVYLTTTGGIVTTDIRTNAAGEGGVVLTTANPRPYLKPMDFTALSPHTIPNPNDAGLMLPITVPDFEYSQVFNSLGDRRENDGMAYVLATTHGKDQNGNDAIVYCTHALIFSGPILQLRATASTAQIAPGQSAGIIIEVYDINGNPPASGSSLTVSTNAGELAESNLMPSAEHYGYGSTRYATSLLNTLDPAKDKATTAVVTVRLESPNGATSSSVQIQLTL